MAANTGRSEKASSSIRSCASVATIACAMIGALVSHGCSNGGAGKVDVRSVSDASTAELATTAGVGGHEVLSEFKLAKPDYSVTSLRVGEFPAGSKFAGSATPERPVNIPLQARRQIVVQFKPGLTREAVSAFFERHRVEPVILMSEIGTVVVQIPDTEQAKAAASVGSVDELHDLAIEKAIDSIARDELVSIAVPNSVLSTFQIKAAVDVESASADAALAVGEQQDWGIDDAHISDIWPKVTGKSRVGVIDVGFSDHDDLTMTKGLPAPASVHSHGNHVSGILCAQHNNIAVRGVLKDCTVVFASSQDILAHSMPVEGSDVIAWASFFSEYIASVLDFIRTNPDVKVINLSLGYNWLPNFNKDPRLEAQMRNTIAGQGRLYMSILEFAAEKDIAIVSAAGNDSTGLAKPLESHWASPFNFGARLMSLTRGWTNALVVEAHDKTGQRAAFSNVGGDISCPGVKILSTTADSRTAINYMSGTSMASPYCAGALVLLRKVIPNLSLKNAMRCIRKSPRLSGAVPILDLKYAVEHCSDNEAEMAFEERSEVTKRWAGFLLDGSNSAATSVESPCRYRFRREFRITAIADRGDGQGPEFTDADSQREIRAYVSELLASGCREPLLVAMRFGIDQEARARLDFAMAIMSEIYRAKYPGGVALIEYPQFGDFNDLPGFTDRVVVVVADQDFKPTLERGT